MHQGRIQAARMTIVLGKQDKGFLEAYPDDPGLSPGNRLLLITGFAAIGAAMWTTLGYMVFG